MTALWFLAGWFLAGFVLAPLIGCHLKRHSPTDARIGRIGERP